MCRRISFLFFHFSAILEVLLNRRRFLASSSLSLLMTDALRALADEPSAGEKKVSDLHRRSTVIVIHDHRPIAADVPLMLAGGVTAKVYLLGVDVDISGKYQESAPRREGWTRKTRESLDIALKEIAADSQHLLLARKAGDVERAKREGKIAILLGVEGGKFLEGNLARLAEFYKLGLRELQLRWAVPNQLVEKTALTDFGLAVVKECHRLGIIVDTTHIPEEAFFQVVAAGKKPLIVSHGTARELGEKRVRAIADSGGVVGIHFYSSYLGNKPTLERVADAVDDLVKKGGMETVSLGVDLFPTEGEWKAFQNSQGTADVSWAIRDLSQMRDVTRVLVARRYGEAHIEAILGGNFLRVCKDVLGS